jgi:hypothetical protein
MWSNRWSTMPVRLLDPDQALPLPDHRATLERMPGSSVPVIRQPWDASDPLAFWAWGRFTGDHLWDRSEDPGEGDDLVARDAGDVSARRAERDAAEALRCALTELEAPDDQLVRLGLA